MKRHHDMGSGPTQRQLRVGELIRRTLSQVLSRGEISDPDLDAVSITVGEVRISPDLRQATVFVLPLGGRDVERALEALERNKGEIRHILAKSVQLKYSPNVKFLADKSFDQMDETNALFASERVRRDVASGSDGEDAE